MRDEYLGLVCGDQLSRLLKAGQGTYLPGTGSCRWGGRTGASRLASWRRVDFCKKLTVLPAAWSAQCGPQRTSGTDLRAAPLS